MFDWVNDIWDWFVQLFYALKDFLTDLPLIALGHFLDAVATLIEAIPVPAFADGVTLGSILSNLPSGVLYFLSQSGLNEGFAILSGAFVFRMIRKAITLFQW